MGERILVVDDSPWEREQLSALFALDGLETVAVADGRRALERLKTESFHLMITDWHARFRRDRAAQGGPGGEDSRRRDRADRVRRHRRSRSTP